MILYNQKSNPGAQRNVGSFVYPSTTTQSSMFQARKRLSEYLSRLCQYLSPNTSIGGKATESFVKFADCMAKPKSFSFDETNNSKQTDDIIVQLKKS